MIAYVKGRLAYTTESAAVVEANGVGYLVNVSPYTLSRLSARDADVQLFTYLAISENAQALYGFLSREEVRLFLMLINVSGIGPKVASAVLGAMPADDLIMAILAEDAAALAKAPGVGKKTAERIVLELRDKMGGERVTGGASSAAGGFVSGSASPKQDAMEALFALGYSRTEAMQAVLEVADESMEADIIIKLSLKKLARSQ